jgi:hypothetical protein
MKFSPQLLPNNPAGITPDWEALLTPISDYMASDKADGGRVECGWISIRKKLKTYSK